MIDAHWHPDLVKNPEKDFQDAELELSIGVGMNYSSCKRVLELSRRMRMYVAIGLHPVYAGKEETKKVKKLTGKENVVCIGEIGIDHHFCPSSEWELQEKIFRSFLAHAEDVGLPCIIHSPRGESKAYSIVKEYKVRAIFHWFNCSSGILRELSREKGKYFITANPAIFYSERMRRNIRKFPLGGIQIESDAPVEFKGVPSSPKVVWKVADTVAELKGVSLKQIQEETSNNVKSFFDIV